MKTEPADEKIELTRKWLSKGLFGKNTPYGFVFREMIKENFKPLTRDSDLFFKLVKKLIDKSDSK